MTAQEENWELMTVLGFPWQDCAKIKGQDRTFLLQKAVEIKEQVMQQQQAEAEMEAKAFQERMTQPEQQAGQQLIGGDGGNPTRDERGLETPAAMQLPGNL